MTRPVHLRHPQSIDAIEASVTYSVEKPPMWSLEAKAYLGPKTKQPLESWEQALLATTEEDAQPAWVVRVAGSIHEASTPARRTLNAPSATPPST